MLTATGCGHKSVQTAAVTTTLANDNSYLDLTPGGRLRILVPILKSGGYGVATGGAPQEEGNTVVLSAANLAGYEVSFYSIAGHADGRVRLRFTTLYSAE